MEKIMSIARVSRYTATPVTSCDRCGQGIKYVSLVTYKDGETQKYGSECINKILAEEPTLAKLFETNSKKLAKYQDYLSILEGPIEKMPYGREYFGRGLYFIADSNGKDIFMEHWLFHPGFDVANSIYNDRPKAELDKFYKDDIACRAKFCAKLKSEIERIELFLGRILAKGLNKQSS
jgi:hypothetical protein